MSLIDIGNRRLSATFLGQGGPLMLLEVGLGAESSSWAAVAEGVASFARVCYYDRAGRGDSDADAKPRGPDVLVDDVHRLLHSAAGSVPCVYVGQSFGGLMARLYAHRYPQDVAAIVLVDSLSEEQFEACGPHFPPATPDEPAPLTGMRSFWQGGWRDPSQNKEGIDLLACREAGRRVRSLGDLPLRVLTASAFVHPPMFPPEHGARLQEIWEGLQRDFTHLSSRASQQVVPDCGHFMQTDKPQVVIDAIADVLGR